MASAIEIYKLYMIGVEYPMSLNDPSPTKSIPLTGVWHTEDTAPSRHNVWRAHRHVGLVLSYNASTQVAVIFLVSSAPRQPQRYIPWKGTPRLPYQTDEVLRPVGADFRNHPGYLNFTHATRVRVLQANAVSRETTPGLACITEIMNRYGNPPKALEIRLLDNEIDLLKSLHGAYWSGLRSPFKATTNGTTNGEGGEDGGEGWRGGEGGVVQGPPASTGVQGLQARGGATDGATTSVEELSDHLGQALQWEDFRNQQISMVEGDSESVAIESLPRCVLVPVTEDDFEKGYCAFESEVGFPWEVEVNLVM